VNRSKQLCSFGASDDGEGRTFVVARSEATEGTTSGFAKGSQMGFTIGRRASLFARNAITEREASLGGNTLVTTVSEEGASSMEDVGTNGTGISTGAMTSEDNGGS